MRDRDTVSSPPIPNSERKMPIAMGNHEKDRVMRSRPTAVGTRVRTYAGFLPNLSERRPIM